MATLPTVGGDKGTWATKLVTWLLTGHNASGSHTQNVQMKIGTYVGDGNATQAITGMGFQPDYLVILPGAHETPWGKTKDMGADAAAFSGTFATLRIISLDTDGFTVGNLNSMNVNLQTNYYVAFKEL